jgi:GNAT superfamily N-acetyltransferase
MTKQFEIRLARPEELPYAFAIDEASVPLFATVGLRMSFADDHPFVVAEHERFRAAVASDALYWAIADGRPVGFQALATRDGRAYLEQLSVLPECGRRGIGAALAAHAISLCRQRGATELWLTTYSHVPWNRPFYERIGFELAAERQCGPELCETLEEQRRYLPEPEQRIAMLRRFGS